MSLTRLVLVGSLFELADRDGTTWIAAFAQAHSSAVPALFLDAELVVEVGEVRLDGVLPTKRRAAISLTDAGGWNVL